MNQTQIQQTEGDRDCKSQMNCTQNQLTPNEFRISNCNSNNQIAMIKHSPSFAILLNSTFRHTNIVTIHQILYAFKH